MEIDTSGFVIAPDDIIKEMGAVCAVVFGRVIRYCKMRDGVCRASVESMAKELGMSRQTVLTHIQTLCNCKPPYLIDTTPDRTGKPHIYKDAGRFRLKVVGEVEQDHLQNLEANPSKILPAPLQNLEETPPKFRGKEELKRGKKEKIPANAGTRAKPTNDLYPIAEALADVCKMSLEANGGRLFAEAKLLAKARPSPTPELIKEHYNGNPSAFWKSRDWRGIKGAYPTPSQVRETWVQANSESFGECESSANIAPPLIPPAPNPAKLALMEKLLSERNNANQ